MEIEEAFRLALDGDAVLFLGAGFSLGAINRGRRHFPLSSDLSMMLMAALGETESVPLQIASELYARRNGEVGLLHFLNEHLGVQSVAPHHVSFGLPNWRRVYTTNYDEVFEKAALQADHQTRSLVLTRQIPAPSRGQVDCIHINGFLPSAAAQNLHSTLILSETANITSRFVDSIWASLLRSDIGAARTVIFAGYSLADLDISRTIVAVESLKRKCVFIVGPNPSLALRSTIENFGTISSVGGVQEAANVLESIAAIHKPTPRRLIFSSFRSPEVTAAPSTSPSAQDVFDFYVKGEIHNGYLVRSLTELKPFYAVKRAEIDAVAERFARGTPTIVLLSRLANGKTVLCESAAAKLRDRFDVFIFTKETLTLPDEIRALRAPERPTVVVVDDYTRHIDLVRELRLNAGPNQFLLLTSRTPTHLTFRDGLQRILGEAHPAELRIDTLSERELQQLDAILEGAGLLAGVASWSKDRRLRVLYRDKGAGEFGGILLWLLESPPIREKLEHSFATLNGKDNAQKVIIAAMALTHVGQLPDIDDIADFIGARSINQVIFSEDRSSADFVRYDRRMAHPRSSLFAAATLRALWHQGHVPQVLEQILLRAWELRHDSGRFRLIARDLMRYSNLRQIVPRDDPPRHVQNYYDQIRNLPPCANNELFWLQFSLADIERRQFDLADRHLRTSYEIAGKINGYDTYQIDNVQALFLLAREIEEQKKDRAFRSFVDASRIIARQMKERRHAYYPFRVATRYGDFWRRIARDWEADQKSVFIGACQNAYGAAQAVDIDLQAIDDINNCREIVRRILIEAGVPPVS
jgi:hypothetical protein